MALKMPSLFNLQLQLQGIQISTTPMRQALSRVGVETLSNRNFDTVPQLIAREDLMSILEREVDWLFVESEGLIRPTDIRVCCPRPSQH